MLDINYPQSIYKRPEPMEMMIPTPTVTRSTGAPAAISQIARLSSSIFPTSDINDITPLSPPIIMIKNNGDKQ